MNSEDLKNSQADITTNVEIEKLIGDIFKPRIEKCSYDGDAEQEEKKERDEKKSEKDFN